MKNFSLVVGETIDFRCDDPNNVKVFDTTESNDPELEDNIYTVYCKPDKFYTVPKVFGPTFLFNLTLCSLRRNGRCAGQNAPPKNRDRPTRPT